MITSSRRIDVLATVMGILLAAGTVQAGSLDSPAAPTDSGSAMYTVTDIYNRLDTGAAGAKRAGSFFEPSGAPGSTGKTLDEIMAKAPLLDAANGATSNDVVAGKTFWGLTSGEWGTRTGVRAPGLVAKTGAGDIAGYTEVAGEDGHAAMRRGVAWPNSRFTDNGNGTVTDNLTGLIWLKNANAFGTRTWAQALTDCATLNSGEGGLTDGSVEGQWRLPNRNEQNSLIDAGLLNPALPSGHPFTSVQWSGSGHYWSGTTYAGSTANAWIVYLDSGVVWIGDKTGIASVWPVRGGQ